MERQAPVPLGAGVGGCATATAKTARRQQWSVKQAVDAYLVSHEFQRKTLKVQQGEASALQKHVVHRLAHVPLGQLDVPCVRRLLRDVEIDTRANARKRRMGGMGAARKTARILSMLLRQEEEADAAERSATQAAAIIPLLFFRPPEAKSKR